MFMMVPFIFFYLFYILDSQYSKKPIFGNKKVDYYNTLNHKFVLPLFDKRYNNIARNSENIRERIRNFGIVCFVSVILFTFGILGCFGRHEFSSNGITTYSIFNNVIEEYSYDEVESYEISAIDIYRYRRIGGYLDSDIYLTVNLKNGYNYTASYNCARDVFALWEMDNLLKDKKKSVNSHDLELFINRHSFSEEELKVIYKLFEI